MRGFDLASWNANHSRYWNHFRTLLRREYPDIEFFRGVEVQDGKRREDGRGRGALHDHFMARTRYAVDEKVLRRLAMAAHFGHEVLVAECAPGSKREAYYVAKYITKSADSRGQVPWRAEVVDVETGEVSEQLVDGRYRTWSMSRGWGLTMAQIRAEAALYARQRCAERDHLSEQSALEVLRTELGVVDEPPETPPAPI